MLSTFSDAVTLAARMTPNRIGAADLEQSKTFSAWDRRASRLANALLGLGLRKGDQIAVLAYNLSGMAGDLRTGRAGVIAMPINFRLVAKEMRDIIVDCDARLLIVQDALPSSVEDTEPSIGGDGIGRIHFGCKRTPACFLGYEDLIASASDTPPVRSCIACYATGSQ